MKNSKRIISAFLVIAQIIGLLIGLTSCIPDIFGKTDNDGIAVSKYQIVPTNNITSVNEMDENGLTKYASFKDEQYYYYIYYMGSVTNVPLQADYPVFEYRGYDYSTSITTSTTIDSTVEKQVEKIIATNSEWSHNLSLEHSMNMEVSVESIFLPASAKIGASFKSGYEMNWGGGGSITTSEISKTIDRYVVQKSETVVFNFDSECKVGLYRYVLMGDFDVYAVIIYDTVTEEFRLTTFTSLYSKRYTLDYTDKNRFIDNTFDQIDWECPELNIESLGGIPEIDISGKGDNNDGTGDDNGGDEIVDISPIHLPLNQSNCIKDNGYNSAEPSTDSAVLEHKQFDIGNYVIYGASKSGNKYYVNEAAGEFSIQFKVNLDPSKLNGTTDIFIENDTSNSALNTSISQ